MLPTLQNSERLPQHHCNHWRTRTADQVVTSNAFTTRPQCQNTNMTKSNFSFFQIFFNFCNLAEYYSIAQNLHFFEIKLCAKNLSHDNLPLEHENVMTLNVMSCTNTGWLKSETLIRRKMSKKGFNRFESLLGVTVIYL